LESINPKPTVGTPVEATGVHIRDLSVRLGEQVVLSGLSLDVAPGEIVSLLGASGCGKSTLLRAIANLVRPTAGEVVFSKPNRRAGDLAFVFQDATLLPWRTVAENVVLPLQLGSPGRSVSQTEVNAALHAVGLSERDYAKFPRELSGGMRMRTSIARALVTDPSILLLDEPFAALDDILRNRLNDLLLELWKERQRTILFVTHNIAEAIYLSHRIAIFGSGRIAEVVTNPLPWPRFTSHRSSPDFATFFGEVSEKLASSTRVVDVPASR
jgi:NitT/TauT family transport system ATP-binding protein